MRIKSLFIIAMLTIAIYGCSSESTLAIKPMSLEFNEVDIGSSDTQSILITNKLGKEVTLSTILIDGLPDFSIESGGATPVTLDKKDELTIVIKFAPLNAGDLYGSLTIGYLEATKEKVIDFHGVGRPVARISLSETVFDFNKKLINKTHSHDIEIENIGTSDLQINSFTFTGANANLFAVTTGGTVPKIITAGTKQSVTIEFSPLVLGTFGADLNIEHNAVNENTPLVITYTGEGIDLDPRITFSKSFPWDFGAVSSTNPSTEMCEIENTGIDPLHIAALDLVTSVDFTIDSVKDGNGNDVNFPHTVDIGKKIFLSVKFEPTVTSSTLSDTLKIEHDGTNENSPLNLTIQGDGTFIPIKTFNYTGAVQQWTIPSGVTSIDVEMYAGEGGIGQRGSSVTEFPGKGGKVTATIPVQPGDVLYIYVGGKGADANNTSSGGGAGGWNGGGKGSTYSTGGGGGGGGASDIRLNGTALTDRIVVAGGGGGSGCNHSQGDGGGQGGGLTGGNAVGTNLPNYKGYGGTQAAGGDLRGTLGIGGDGDPGSRTGGGGGGGYYGGGGSTWQGAGGGSSYTASNATSVVHTQGDHSGDGQIIIYY